MWALRVLNGPQAGQTFPLKNGKNILGRSPQCDIKILAQGVSKTHCEIHVLQEKIMLVDLKSSNGTFINGVKIQNGILKTGEKFSLHDILMDIVPAVEKKILTPQSLPQPSSQGNSPQRSQQNMVYPMDGSGALQPQMQNQAWMPNPSAQPTMQPFPQAHLPPMNSESQSQPAPAAHENPNLSAKLQAYLERVVMPGVYRLAQLFELRWVLGGFVAAYIFLVTLLSMIPMTQIARESIVTESKRRAFSLAQTLASTNKKSFAEGNMGALSTYSAESQEGVREAYLVQEVDGTILAPASKAGRPTRLSFVNQLRRERRALTLEIDGSTIGAGFPLDSYDPETGEMIVKAYAVVIYDTGSVAFDEGKVISLFMQTLMIALITGALLFYFLYKLVEFPMQSLNSQLSLALRERKADLQVTFQFPVLQELIAQLNSLLVRHFQGDEAVGGFNAQASGVDFQSESQNLVQMFAGPGLAVGSEGQFLAANHGFEQLARTSSAQLQTRGLAGIPDSALQQNIEHLMAKSREVPHVLHVDQLEFSGHLCQLQCQAFVTQGNIDYFLITVIRNDSGGGESS